jgi:hydroxymethylbilane synthase
VKLRLGARGSALSLAQAELVRRALAAHADVEIVTVKTTGDRLSETGEPIGWKGDFTKELDAALLSGRIDLAVHSLKDVPSAIPEGLLLAAVPRREDPSDVLVTYPRRRLGDLPAGARVGTSSPRRRAQLLAARADLEILEARGNVDTRIRRLREREWDAIVLARAGLARLGRLEEIAEVFSEDTLLPAVGQGALALVARRGDDAALGPLREIDDSSSHSEVLAERSMLRGLEAGCRAPVAGRAHVVGGSLRLSGGVFSADGSRILREAAEGPVPACESIGRSVADRLLARGAADLIAESQA